MGSASALLNWQNVIGRFFGHVYILEWYYHTNFIAHDSLSSPPPLLENHSLILGLKEFWLYINLILYYYYSIPIICFWIMYSCPCGLLAHMVFSSFFQFNRIVNNVRYLGHHIFKALFLINCQLLLLLKSCGTLVDPLYTRGFNILLRVLRCYWIKFRSTLVNQE